MNPPRTPLSEQMGDRTAANGYGSASAAAGNSRARCSRPLIQISRRSRTATEIGTGSFVLTLDQALAIGAGSPISAAICRIWPVSSRR
ncbi:hypothetical protein ACFQ0B_32750 [Nonomuraea thailandensis]